MKKEEIIKAVITTIVVLVIGYLLLRLSYADGMKSCTEYGYDETYCHNELVK